MRKVHLVCLSVYVRAEVERRASASPLLTQTGFETR